ncbi:phosphotyrosine protein phosphatase [Trametes polyzona]|nr:phosphotyrosine protein phosphatase [Trametes polyzona]
MSNLSVLVVCLGNICRSPIGEAVLKHVAKERGIDLTVDSAGTSNYHIGEDPDDRSVAICRKFGVPIKHAARQVQADDFRRFTHILAADEANLRNLNRVRPRDATAEVRLWGAYLDNEPIADPYYGGMKDFEEVYHQCVKLSNAFLDEVVGKSTQTVE